MERNPAPSSYITPAAIGSRVRELRRELNLSQDKFGERVGLSFGKISELERGLYSPGVSVALEIERLSGGRIDAGDLNEDVRASRHALINNGAGAEASAGKAGKVTRSRPREEGFAGACTPPTGESFTGEAA